MRCVAIALVLAGCANVRVVERTAVGGRLELDGDRARAMDDANREMAAHCGVDNATITYTGAENGAYRVHYRCNGS